MARPHPKQGDTVRTYYEAEDIDIIGTVADLLSVQFTIHVLTPEKFLNKTHFIFYEDTSWQILDPKG